MGSGRQGLRKQGTGFWAIRLTQIIFPWVFAIPTNVQQGPDIMNDRDWVPSHVVQACRRDKDLEVGSQGRKRVKEHKLAGNSDMFGWVRRLGREWK